MRLLVAATVVLASLAAAPPAGAVEPCQDESRPRVLADGLGTLESVISGADWRLYFTAAEGGGGRVLVGFGNSIPNGAVGTFGPTSGLLLVDPRSGSRRVYASGLSMANGLARASDGTIYASDDAGTRDSLYAVEFGGRVTEIRAARAARSR